MVCYLWILLLNYLLWLVDIACCLLCIVCCYDLWFDLWLVLLFEFGFRFAGWGVIVRSVGGTCWFGFAKACCLLLWFADLNASVRCVNVDLAVNFDGGFVWVLFVSWFCCTCVSFGASVLCGCCWLDLC